MLFMVWEPTALLNTMKRMKQKLIARWRSPKRSLKKLWKAGPNGYKELHMLQNITYCRQVPKTGWKDSVAGNGDGRAT